MEQEQNKAKNKDKLGGTARFGEIVSAIFMLLLLSFFVNHQTQNTGFFTEDFGTMSMICLYVPLLLGATAPAMRAATGRRNPGRPFEVITSLALSFGSLWLLIMFPLNYTHLPDVLPESLQFLVAWVTDDIGKFVLGIQVIIGPFSAVFNTLTYFTVMSKKSQYQQIQDAA